MGGTLSSAVFPLILWFLEDTSLYLIQIDLINDPGYGRQEGGAGKVVDGIW